MKMSAMDTGQQCTQLTQLKQHKTLLSSHSSSKWPHRTFGGLEWTTAIYSIVIFLLLSATVTSGQTPTISSNSDNNNFQEGTNISLSCFVSSMNVILNWSFPYNLSNYVIVNGIVQDVYWSNLTYNATALDNSRTLTCSSSSSYQSISINVILVPHQPIITGPDISNASVAYTWKCLSTGASLIPPNVYWRTGDGLALTDNVSKSTLITSKPNANFVYTITSTITVSLPPTSPEYKLVCSVVHFLYPYSVEKSDQKNITVLYPPQITTSNEPNVTINETQDVTLVCSIISNPSASQVIWYKDGNILDINSTRYSGGNISVPNLTIKSVSKSDAGNYTCSAVNQQGTSTSPNTTLIIKYVPEVTYNSTSYTGNAGGNLTIPCPVSAVPDVIEIIWQRIINSVVQTINVSSGTRFSGVNISTKQYDLTINPLQSDDIGIYYCTAKNIMGNVTGSHLSVTVIFAAKPQIDVLQTSVVAIENQSFNLTCNVSSLDYLTDFYWTKNGSQLNTTDSLRYSGGTITQPTLTVLSATSDDVGTYNCVASNSNGNSTSDGITVTLNGKPHVVVADLVINNISLNGIILLTCNVSANPPLTNFYWAKGGQIIDLADSSKYLGKTFAQHSLIINNISFNDSGNYTCVATNSVGTTNSSAIMITVSSLPIITVTPNPANVTEGTSQFILNCSFIASPPVSSVSWTKDGQVINTTSQPTKYSGSNLEEPSLTIKSVQRSDAGTYVCMATNDIGRAQSASLSLNVQFLHVVTVNNATVIVSAGSNLSLNCIVEANPAIASLYWYKSGIVISSITSSDKYSGGTVSNPSLTVFNITVSDAGDYYCNATNSVGSNSSPAVTVLVSDFPVVSVNQTSFTFLQGTPLVTIYCSAGGYPSVTTVYWEKDGVTLNVSSQPTKFDVPSLTNQSLTIFNVSREDSGRYSCVAQNSVGTKKSPQVTVTVNYPPYLTVDSDSVTQILGASVTLMCLVSASPAITNFQWMKSDTNLTSSHSSKYSGGTLQNTNLTIYNLDPGTDSGSYACVAANSVGRTVSIPVKLVITKLPIIDANQTQVNVTENQGITLRCPAVPLDSLTDLYWTKNGIKINTSNIAKYEGGNVTTPSLTIKYLAIDDSGLYLCYATNQYGTTTGGNSTITLQYAPVLIVSNTTITKNAGETIELTCTVSSNPAITNFYWLSSDATVINSTTNASKYSGGTIANTTLVIMNASISDIVNYTCVAENSVGARRSNPVSINVIIVPVIDTTTANTTTINNANVTLACPVTSLYTLTDLYWTKDGQRLITTSTLKYSGGNTTIPSLTITSTSPIDSGSYVCVATNQFGTSSGGNTTLNITYKPVLVVSNTTITNNAGESITLTCAVTSNPAISSFYWLKSDTAVINSSVNSSKYSGGTITNTTLIIMNSSSSDIANYTCVAQNSVGDSKSNPVAVNVITTPVIITITPNVTAASNTTVTLACSVTPLNSLTDLYWTKDDQRLSTTNTLKYSGGNTTVPSLTITSTNPIDSGSYVCVATNQFGTSSGGNTTLSITYLPNLIVSNTTITSNAGETIELTCTVNSNPAITNFYWLMSDTTVINSINNSTKYSGGSMTNTTLSIMNASRSDIANYSCVAQNSVGSSKSNPVAVYVITFPVIATTTPNITTVSNVTVTLACPVTPLNSLTDLYWTKDGQRLSTTNTLKYSGGNTTIPSLTITSTSPVDSGSYVCVATNQFGTSSGGNTTLSITYFPLLTVSNTTITNIAGETILLTCIVNSNPAITNFYWLKSETTIINSTVNPVKYSGGSMTNTTLLILNASSSDIANYTCVANNTVGNTKSNPVAVNVITVPVFTPIAPNMTAVSNSTVTLACQVTPLNSLTDLYWTKDGQRLSTTNTLKYSGGNTTIPSLTITSTSPIDSGSYVCVATNQFGTSSGGNTTLNITYLPQLIVSNTTITSNAGETILITCTVNSNPAITNFYWLKSDTVINSTANVFKYLGGTITNTTLTIINASSSDIDNYTCVAENSVGLSRSNPVAVNVITVPFITTITPNVTVASNTTVTLACQVIPLNSLTDLYWTKDGQRLSTTNTLKYSGGNTTVPSLTITSTSPIDSGSYVCVATNQFGTSSGGNTTLNITYLPQLIVSNRTITYNAGETIVLTCTVNSNPAITNFFWLKSDTIVINSSVNASKYSGGIITNTTLLILNASSSDIASYTCVAENLVGNTKSNPVAVNVITVPVVTTSTPNITAVINATVTLACQVTPLNSLTDLYWTKDGQRLSTTDTLKYSGGNSSEPSLTVYSTGPVDSGSYVCVATNQFGTSSGRNTTLSITYLPQLLVSNTTITNNAGETIILTCIVNSNPAVTNFYWLKSDTTLINSTSNATKYSGGSMINTTLLILNASGSDIASYSCVAENSVGRSKSNPVSVVVITVPVITTVTPNITAFSNTTVTLNCQITPLNSLTDLYWTKDGQRLNTTNTLKYTAGNTTIPSLTITSTSPVDSGSYVCVATNQFGTSSGGNTTLSITYLPQLTVSNTTITNYAGETIILTCNVNSNPAITNLYWLKLETTVVNSTTNPSKYSGGTLTNTTLIIINASSTDIANYTCVAQNSVGTSRSNPVLVNVISVPVISTQTTNITAVSNTTVTLLCQVTSLNSLTDLYWTKDGQRLSTTNTLKYSGGNTTIPSLTIISNSPIDSGSYICVATNQFGTSSGGITTLNITYLPQLTVSNTTITKNAGETILLTCTVISNPTITNLYWLKSETTVVNSTTNPSKYSGGTFTNTTLIIMNASSSDIANYTCVAQNSVGSSISNPVAVNIITMPIVTISHENVNATRDSNTTLNCFVSQLESLTDLYWTKDNQRLIISNISKYSGGNKIVPSLTIKSLSLLDAGSYKCVATNLIGTSEGNISLNIQYPPVITTDSSNITVISGATLTLTCAVSANPTANLVYWTKNNVRLFPSQNQTKYLGGTLSMANLTIFNVDATLDSGVYICVAENIIGATYSQFYNVTIASLPVVSQPNSTNIPGHENATVTLECSVTPLDSLTDLYWTKNGLKLNTSGSSKYTGGTKATPNLTVNFLTDSDVGVYECVAVNNFGTTGGPNITINLQYKPRINVSSTPVNTTASTSVRLFCNVSANPDISSFYWSKTGSGIINPSSNSNKYGGATITNTSLFIFLTDGRDSGNYTCSAGNSVGNTTSDAVALRVISKPLVTVSPTSLTVPEGQAEVRFNCSIQAVPAVSAVNWVKDGKILNVASQPAHYSGGTMARPDLSILNVTKADAGIYACNASNNEGVGTSESIRLDVTYSPAFNSSSGSSQGSVGQNITLSCDFVAYPPITQLYWLKDGNKINSTLNPTKYSGGTVSMPSLTIINLNINTDAGSYQCVTNNSIGSNQGPSVNVTVVFDPYITVVNKTLTVTEGSNFTIDLAVHMYPPFDSIIWYKDNSQVPVGNQTKYQNGTVNSPSLSVLSAVPQDSGTYRIIARNSNSTVNETIAVDVLYTPKISTSPQTFNVTNNSSKIIPCEVQANPEVSSIRWQKLDLDSGQISSITIGGRFSGGNISNPSLTITGILPSDAAVYQCSAFNALGNTSGPYMTLRVFYKPEVTVSVNPSQISLDDKFELNCSAKSYPDVTGYLWYNGTTIISRTNSFVKNNATAYDYIQFRCSVSNSMGTTNAYITPNITFKPVQSDNGQETILATKPSSVTLECKVIANPAPSSYRWFNGTYEIAGATNYSLTILIDSDDDFTVYSCAATNIFGELNPARNFDIQQDIPKTGSSTGSSGLSTATIILIVIIAIILLIILILIVVFCCLQGVCQKCVKRKNVKVEPTNIKETSAAPSAASINNLLVSPKPVAPVAAGSPGLIISLPEKAGGPKPFYLPPLDPQAEAATEKFYRERKRRSRKKKKAKRSKEEEKNLTENGSDEGKTSPPPMTGRSDGTIANTSTA